MNQSKYAIIGVGMIMTSFAAIALIRQPGVNNENVVASGTGQPILESAEQIMDKAAMNDLNHSVINLQSELGDIKSELVLIHQNLAALKSTQAGTEMVLSEMQKSRSDGTVSVAANLEYNQQTEEEQNMTEPKEEDRIADMDYAMYQQEPDVDWDGQMEEQLRQNFQDANISNIQLQNVTCQGVVCRIELAHNDETAFFEMLEGDAQIVSWDHKGKIATTIDAMGNNITVMYVTREGEKFPQSFQ